MSVPNNNILEYISLLLYNSHHAGVMELVDVADSKSAAGNSMPVRVRPPAPNRSKLRSLYFRAIPSGLPENCVMQRKYTENFRVHGYGGLPVIATTDGLRA